METQFVESPCTAPVRLQKSEPFRCVAIIGVGLIGGSLGMALRTRGLADRVIGVDRSDEVVSQAQSAGAIDSGTVDIAAVREADCVVFATPVGVLPDLMLRAAPFVRPDAIVTDVGSVKQRIVAVGERLFGARFVGGHPMAGSEASGVQAARQDLFCGAAWALVAPADLDSREAAARLDALVASLGARPIHVTAEAHDHLVALVSHLPHVLSFAFARAVAADPDSTSAISMAGGSYRDIIRVSQSSPELWSDILLDNKDRLLPVLTTFEEALHLLRSAIEAGDPASLLQYMREQQIRA